MQAEVLLEPDTLIFKRQLATKGVSPKTRCIRMLSLQY